MRCKAFSLRQTCGIGSIKNWFYSFATPRCYLKKDEIFFAGGIRGNLTKTS